MVVDGLRYDKVGALWAASALVMDCILLRGEGDLPASNLWRNVLAQSLLKFS